LDFGLKIYHLATLHKCKYQIFANKNLLAKKARSFSRCRNFALEYGSTIERAAKNWK
jgi:hypothetical protein